jgi:ABC-type Fe3+-hydroxamate transport system, periplasmic component
MNIRRFSLPLHHLVVASLVCLFLFPNITQSSDTPRRVTDFSGKTLHLPDKIERVAPTIGAFAQITAILSQGDVAIAAAATSNISRRFKKVFPWYAKGNPNEYDIASLEDIIASDAQVVYGPQIRFSDEQLRTLEKAGIPFVTVDKLSTIDELCESTLLIGDILGGKAPDRALTFVSYYKNNVAEAKKRTKDIVRKPRFITMSYSGNAYTTTNRKDISHEYIEAAGGENVAADFNSDTSGMGLAVDIEQLARWDPEVIMMGTPQGRDTVLSDPALAHLSAVKAKKVYACPQGIYRWSVRSGEGAMLPLWLGSILHPGLFADIDMRQVVRDFFKRFYAYDISDAEIVEVLEHQSP